MSLITRLRKLGETPPMTDPTAVQIVCRQAVERLEERRAEIQRLQARIDELMLEYCPDEMTPEQIENWKRSQASVGN